MLVIKLTGENVSEQEMKYEMDDKGKPNFLRKMEKKSKQNLCYEFACIEYNFHSTGLLAEKVNKSQCLCLFVSCLRPLVWSGDFWSKTVIL